MKNCRRGRTFNMDPGSLELQQLENWMISAAAAAAGCCCCIIFQLAGHMGKLLARIK